MVKDKKICIYCGAPADTRDHVPPKCLFSPPYPGKMITVPACRECNESFGPQEEHCRNILTSLAENEGHPSVVKHLEGKRNRSLKRSQPALREVLDSLRDVEIQTPEGHVIGTAPAFDLDDPRFDALFERTVRGLIYHHSGSPAPVNLDVEWKTVDDINELPISPDLFKSNVSYQGKIGTEFEHFGFMTGPDRQSLWIMQFFGGKSFMVLAKPRVKTKRQHSQRKTEETQQ